MATNYIGYKFKIESIATEVQSQEVQYGTWEEVWHNYASSFATKVDTNPDIASVLDLQSGTVAYVVWAEWTYGDSFGEAIKGSCDVFGIFEYEVFAQELVDHLENRTTNCGMFAPNEEDSDVCKCVTGDGQQFNYRHLPWVGYFERLESVEIQKVNIT